MVEVGVINSGLIENGISTQGYWCHSQFPSIFLNVHFTDGSNSIKKNFEGVDLQNVLGRDVGFLNTIFSNGLYIDCCTFPTKFVCSMLCAL